MFRAVQKPCKKIIKPRKLTDTSVKRLPFAERGAFYIVRDSKDAGFHLRVSGKAKIYKFQIDVRLDGARTTIGRTLGDAGKITAAEARAAAKKIIADRDAGTFQPEKVKAADPTAITFDHAWKKYREASRAVPSVMWLEFGGAFSGNMKISFQAARSIG